jgi:hypothetical protein
MMVDEDGNPSPLSPSPPLPPSPSPPPSPRVALIATRVRGVRGDSLLRTQERLREEGGRRQGRAGMQPVLPLPPGMKVLLFCFSSSPCLTCNHAFCPFQGTP